MRKIIFFSILLIAVTSFINQVRPDLPIGADIPKADVKMKDVSGVTGFFA